MQLRFYCTASILIYLGTRKYSASYLPEDGLIGLECGKFDTVSSSLLLLPASTEPGLECLEAAISVSQAESVPMKSQKAVAFLMTSAS